MSESVRKRITLTLRPTAEDMVESLYMRHRTGIDSRLQRTKFDVACLLAGYACNRGWGGDKVKVAAMHDVLARRMQSASSNGDGRAITLQFPLNSIYQLEQRFIHDYDQSSSTFKRQELLITSLTAGFLLIYGWLYAEGHGVSQ